MANESEEEYYARLEGAGAYNGTEYIGGPDYGSGTITGGGGGFAGFLGLLGGLANTAANVKNAFTDKPLGTAQPTRLPGQSSTSFSTNTLLLIGAALLGVVLLVVMMRGK